MHFAGDQIMELAVNNIPAMIAYWDKDQICRFANKAYLDWFGKTQAEMINKMTLSDLLGDLYERNHPFINRVLEGVPQSFERDIPTPSGEIRSSLANYYPDIQAGEVQGFVAHVTDISGIKRLEKELVSSEMKFRALVENAPDAIVMVNDKRLIQLVNSQAEKLFGYTKDEMYLQPVEMLLPEHLRARHVTHIAGFNAHPVARPMGIGLELFAFHKLGHQIPVEISITPIELEGAMRVTATVRDISERKETERKLIESRTNLESLAKTLQYQNTQLADFAFITSHNLRSPAGNLKMLLQMYKSSEKDEEKALLLSMFETVVSHLNATLDTLVKTLKVNTVTELQLERIYFEEILSRAKELLSGQIEKTKARIEVDFSQAPSIEYNRNYLESIILNLLSNALKYSSQDRNSEIRITTELQEGRVKMTFSDNGLGIDMVKHGDQLFQLNKVFHDHPDARGVGLYMTRTQIESMGGTIQASGEPNKGMTFVVVF